MLLGHGDDDVAQL